MSYEIYNLDFDPATTVAEPPIAELAWIGRGHSMYNTLRNWMLSAGAMAERSKCGVTADGVGASQGSGML